MFLGSKMFTAVALLFPLSVFKKIKYVSNVIALYFIACTQKYESTQTAYLLLNYICYNLHHINIVSDFSWKKQFQSVIYLPSVMNKGTCEKWKIIIPKPYQILTYGYKELLPAI